MNDIAPAGGPARKLLVVDDDPVERRLLTALLGKGEGYEVVTAETGALGLERAVASVSAVILDLQLPDMTGLEVLAQLRRDRPELPVIMLTGVTDTQKAVEAARTGAYDYLTKPFDQERLLVTLRNALEKNDLRAQVEELRQKSGAGPALSRITGESQALKDVIRQIRQVAPSDMTVLIQGETGAGKEMTARALHEESRRAKGPFVAVDCGALTETLLESELFGHEKGAFTGADRRKEGQIALAEGGTLFLDEIGNLPLGLQAKLLRVLQERAVKPVGAEKTKPVNARFVAATNADLETEAREGRFRQDLYYRLAEFTLRLPPLRDRREDIPALAGKFLREASSELRRNVLGLEPEALERLMAHAWPGNVRELRNVVRQGVLLSSGTTLGLAQVGKLLGRSKTPRESQGPVEVPLLPGQSLKQIAETAVEEAEKQAIRSVLKSTGGNKSQAAKILKTDYKTLHVKIKKYGL